MRQSNLSKDRIRTPNKKRKIEEDIQAPIFAENTDDDIIFLKNANPETQRDLTIEKTVNTFQYRRALEKDIVGNFPRFLDTIGLVNLNYYCCMIINFIIFLLIYFFLG